MMTGEFDGSPHDHEVIGRPPFPRYGELALRVAAFMVCRWPETNAAGVGGRWGVAESNDDSGEAGSRK